MRWAVTIGAVGGALFFGQMAVGQTIAGTLRPVIRPASDVVSRADTPSIQAVTGTSVARPKLRPAPSRSPTPPPVEASAKDAGFQQWLGGLRVRAADR